MSDAILAPIAALQTPNSQDLSRRAQSALDMVQSMTIDNAESYGFAGEELQAIKKRGKALEEQRTAITGPLNAALKAVNALFKPAQELLDSAESVIKTKMIGFQRAEEARAAEARRIAEAEAAAERARMQAEADAAAKLAAAAAAAGQAEAAAEAAAQAEAMQLAAQVVTAPVNIAPIVKAAGISKVSVAYKARVTDPMALICHIAQNPDLARLVDVNTSALNAMAKALEKNLNLPGVEVYTEDRIAARAA